MSTLDDLEDVVQPPLLCDGSICCTGSVIDFICGKSTLFVHSAAVIAYALSNCRCMFVCVYVRVCVCVCVGVGFGITTLC